MRATWVILCLAAGGCVSAPTPKQQPPGGYEALKFKSTVSLRDHSINTYTFMAGSTLISDHVSSAGQIYCGTAFVNEAPAMVCVGYDGGSLTLGPEDGMKRVTRPVVPGAVELTRMPV